MIRHSRLMACLAAAVLATSCTVYKVKELDGKALAAKGGKGKILSVMTGDDPAGYVFSEKDPAVIKDGAIVGSLHLSCLIEPFDIADIDPDKAGPKVVLKDGTRFRVTSSQAAGERIDCDGVQTVRIPLQEVTRAKVRKVDTAASIFGTLGGVVLVAGALVVDAIINSDDDEFENTATGSLIASLSESEGTAGGGSGRRLSNDAILGLTGAYDAAAETEFWTEEWTPLGNGPAEDGKLRVRLGDPANVPRGVDEAKLLVVDHPLGSSVAPDVSGAMRAYSDPVPPETAAASDGKSILELVSAQDGELWRSAAGDLLPDKAGPVRDEISLSFPRPKGARKAKLIVAASTSAWRAEFAREVRDRISRVAQGAKDEAQTRKAGAPYQEWEYGKVRVKMLTVSGWQTVQAIFVPGPLPARDTVYDLDLCDVGGNKIQLRLSPPAGYWLIDRIALAFGADPAIEAAELSAEAVDGPDAAEVLKAIAVEDGTTLHLPGADEPAVLTFALPPPKEGRERTVFLRTVSCYEMPKPATKIKTG